MKVKFLSAKGYLDEDANNGDCIIIDTDKELVIYDCGCEEHADRVIDYMREHNYKKAKFILSHNDKDHFGGLNKLIDEKKISQVYTLLLLKYKKELKDKIDDQRITENSLAEHIKEIFDNIYSLSNRVELKDIFEDIQVCTDIDIVGPDKEYALNAVAKRIDNREGDSIDKETIINAVSTQVKIKVGLMNLLLCGDSSFEAIEDKIDTYECIQLPHHGKLEQAASIFKQKGSLGVTYYVSDNTGKTNGGSDNLPKKGYNILNTKLKDQICDYSIISNAHVVGSHSKE